MLRKNLRASLRALAGSAFLLAVFFIGVPLQVLVVRPVFGNRTFFPRLICEGLVRIFGLKIEFNAASVPIERKRPVWYVANHLSELDPLVLGSVLKTMFVAADFLERIPVVRTICSAAEIILVSRSKDEKLKAFDRGGVIGAFNEGDNVMMFPEANTNDGTLVNRFNAGLVEILYGREGMDWRGRAVKLEKDICVQPIAIRVKEVEGRDAFAEPELRDTYSLFYEKSHLKRLWRRLQCDGITLELTVFPAMEPKGYPDARTLMNAAHELVRQVVAPDQTDVKKSPLGSGGFGPPPV